MILSNLLMGRLLLLIMLWRWSWLTWGSALHLCIMRGRRWHRGLRMLLPMMLLWSTRTLLSQTLN